MLVILDANALISAVISPGGPCAALLGHVRRKQIQAVVSPALIDELNRVLSRPKFDRHVTPSEIGGYIDELERMCRLVPDPPNQISYTRDPADDYLIALALAVGADFVVSGDKDLLESGLSEPLVLDPRRALERVSE